jgi:hypothetical protein
MNNFSQKTTSRKPRTQQCGKRKGNPDEFEVRIMKVLEEGNQPNRHLPFFKGILCLFKISTKRRPLSFRWEFFS